MDLEEIIKKCELFVDNKKNQNEFHVNSWDVSDPSEFLHYICPECDEKFRNLSSFGDHAIENHPRGRQFFRCKIPMKKRNQNKNILQKEVNNSLLKSKQPKENFNTFDEQNILGDFDMDIDPIFENEDNVNTTEVSLEPRKKSKKPKKSKKSIKNADEFELVAINVVKDLKKEHKQQESSLSNTENIFYKSLSNYIDDKENQSGFFLQLNPDQKILGQHNIKKPKTSEIVLAVGAANDANFDKQAFHDNCKYIANAGEQANVIEEWKNPKIEIDTTSDPELPYKCSLCKELVNPEEEFKFQFQFQLIHHFLNVHQIKDFEYEICQWCVEVFHDSQSFETHFQTVHKNLNVPKWAYECDKCYKRQRAIWYHKDKTNYPSAKELIQHLNEKHQIQQEDPFICDICEKTFCIHEEYLHHKLHVHEANEINQFTCDQCPQSYFDENKYLVHQLSHEPETEIHFCKNCSVVVSTKKQLMEHYLSIHPETDPLVFVCFDCDFYTMLPQHNQTNNKEMIKTIMDHYALEHNQPNYKPFICQEKEKDGSRCQYRGFKKCDLLIHIKRRHKGGPEVICFQCGKISSSETLLMSHIKRTHEVDRTKRDVFCDKCTFSTYSEFWLKRHILRKHQTEKHYSCEFCPVTKTYKCELEAHIDRCHPETGEKTYFCETCGEGYIYKSSLNMICKKRHKKQKGEPGVKSNLMAGRKIKNSKKKKDPNSKSKTRLGFIHQKTNCQYCQERISVGFIPKHILAYHPEKLNPSDILNCELCSEKFLTNAGLDRHRRYNHNSYKSFCQKCEKFYRFTKDSKEHKCQPKREFSCDFCGKILGEKSRLRDHINGIHKNIKPYKCDVCDKRWPSLKAKKGHMDQVHKRVVCDICNTEVYNMIALKHHRVLVHKKREGFLCEYCPKKVFFCETFLNKHLKEKHSKTQIDFGNEHSD